MIKIRDFFFPFLKLFNTKNTNAKRLIIVIETIFMSVIYFILIVYFFGHYFYSESLQEKNIAVYCSSEDLSKVKNNINEVKQILQRNYLYDNEYEVDIYIAKRPIFNLLKTFFLFSTNTDGINLFDKIFISSSLVNSDTKKNQYLKKIMIHEIIHSLQAKKYGGFIYQKMKTPNWVQEGYAVYVSRSMTYEDEEDNIKKFLKVYRESKFEKFNSYDMYRVYGLMVHYSIEKMHKSVDDLHLDKVDYDEVLDSFLREYNITKQ